MTPRGWAARKGVLAAWFVALVLAAVPVVTVAIPATVRIPRVEHPRAGAPAARALFSHRTHGQFRCYQCHPSTFPQALAAFSHADMAEGRFCGACHDGDRAEAVATFACASCHVAR